MVFSLLLFYFDGGRLLCQLPVQGVPDGKDELLGVELFDVGERCDGGKVSCHLSRGDGVEGCPLQRLCKVLQRSIAVQLAALVQGTGPGKDRGHGVRGLLLSV